MTDFDGLPPNEAWPFLQMTTGPIEEGDRAMLAEFATAEEALSVSRYRSVANNVYRVAGPNGAFFLKVDTGHFEGRVGREAATLGYLAAHNPPLEIPELVRYDPHKGILITREVEGYAQTPTGLCTRTPGLRRKEGEKLGAFVGWLAGIDPVEFAEVLRPHGDPFVGWEGPITRLGTFEDERYPTVSRLAKRLCDEWQQRYPQGLRSGKLRVIHDELKLAHHIYDHQEHIAGIVDLEGVTVGLPVERSLRWLADPVLSSYLEGCIEGYDRATGETLDRELIDWWATLHAFLVICYNLRNNIPDVNWFLTMQRRAARAFPDEDLSEIYRAIVEEFEPPRATDDWQDALYGVFAEAARHVERSIGPRRKLTPQETIAVIAYADPYDGILLVDK